MPNRPHYHDCPGCTGTVLCTKTGDHERSPCFLCRKALRALREFGQTAEEAGKNIVRAIKEAK